MSRVNPGTAIRPVADLQKGRLVFAANVTLATVAALISLALIITPPASAPSSANVNDQGISGQGQYDSANMGGTPLAPQQAAISGQHDPANMGGTPQTDDGLITVHQPANLVDGLMPSVSTRPPASAVLDGWESSLVR